jgi:type III restriction enzyme
MGEGSKPQAPLVVEIDSENKKKNIETLDIEIPILSPRIYREYKNLSQLDVSTFGNQIFALQQFSEEEKREIVFKDITTNEITHTTILDTDTVANYQSVIGYFTQSIMKDLRLVSGYDILYGKVKEFVQKYLFDKPVDLEDLNTLRNLSELAVSKTIQESFKKKINALTVLDKGEAEIRDYIKISKCRPFVAKDQGYLIPKKSVFNKIIGDSGFELEFASFLESCEDIISYVKNYFAVSFRLDYKTKDGDISNYYPDFIVKKSQKEIWIVETKGREDLEDPLKLERLKQWCDDVNKKNSGVTYSWLYVKQDDYEKYKPKNFTGAVKLR